MDEIILSQTNTWSNIKTLSIISSVIISILIFTTHSPQKLNAWTEIYSFMFFLKVTVYSFLGICKIESLHEKIIIFFPFQRTFTIAEEKNLNTEVLYQPSTAETFFPFALTNNFFFFPFPWINELTNKNFSSVNTSKRSKQNEINSTSKSIYLEVQYGTRKNSLF